QALCPVHRGARKVIRAAGIGFANRQSGRGKASTDAQDKLLLPDDWSAAAARPHYSDPLLVGRWLRMPPAPVHHSAACAFLLASYPAPPNNQTVGTDRRLSCCARPWLFAAAESGLMLDWLYAPIRSPGRRSTLRRRLEVELLEGRWLPSSVSGVFIDNGVIELGIN